MIRSAWLAPATTSAPAPAGRIASAVGALVSADLPRPAAVALATWLATAPDEDLVAIRPAALPPAVADPVSALITAYAVGLVGLKLQLLCGWCGSITARLDALCDVTPQFPCPTCRATENAILDATVEVVFRPATTFRPLLALDPGALEAGARFRLHHCHPGAHTPDGEPYRTALVEHAVALARLAPGEGIEVLVAERARPTDLVEVVALPEAASHFAVATEGGGPATAVACREAFAPPEQEVRPGKLAFAVRNERPYPIDVLALWIPRTRRPMQPARIDGVFTVRDLMLAPGARSRLAAVMLPAEALQVAEITVWFSDLVGSTLSYDAEGDIEAFRRVQEHFAAITAIVRDHGGVVWKTLGDSVMAAFTRPAPAVRAARLAARCEVGGWVVRVGLHRGPVLVVSAGDRPDFFGQTVNLAARLQALAGPGEILVGAGLLELPDVLDEVADGLVEVRDVSVRGLRHPVPVARVRRSGPGMPATPAGVPRPG